MTDEAKQFIINKGSNVDFGARPLRRALENFVEDPLAEELLKGEFKGQNTITVDINDVGGKKHLKFEGQMVEPEPEEEAVGAAVKGGDEAEAPEGKIPDAGSEE